MVAQPSSSVAPEETESDELQGKSAGAAAAGSSRSVKIVSKRIRKESAASVLIQQAKPAPSKLLKKPSQTLSSVTSPTSSDQTVSIAPHEKQQQLLQSIQLSSSTFDPSLPPEEAGAVMVSVLDRANSNHPREQQTFDEEASTHTHMIIPNSHHHHYHQKPVESNGHVCAKNINGNEGSSNHLHHHHHHHHHHINQNNGVTQQLPNHHHHRGHHHHHHHVVTAAAVAVVPPQQSETQGGQQSMAATITTKKKGQKISTPGGGAAAAVGNGTLMNSSEIPTIDLNYTKNFCSISGQGNGESQLLQQQQQQQVQQVQFRSGSQQQHGQKFQECSIRGATTNSINFSPLLAPIDDPFQYSGFQGTPSPHQVVLSQSSPNGNGCVSSTQKHVNLLARAEQQLPNWKLLPVEIQKATLENQLEEIEVNFNHFVPDIEIPFDRIHALQRVQEAQKLQESLIYSLTHIKTGTSLQQAVEGLKKANKLVDDAGVSLNLSGDPSHCKVNQSGQSIPVGALISSPSRNSISLKLNTPSSTKSAKPARKASKKISTSHNNNNNNNISSISNNKIFISHPNISNSQLTFRNQPFELVGNEHLQQQSLSDYKIGYNGGVGSGINSHTHNNNLYAYSQYEQTTPKNAMLAVDDTTLNHPMRANPYQEFQDIPLQQDSSLVGGNFSSNKNVFGSPKKSALSMNCFDEEENSLNQFAYDEIPFQVKMKRHMSDPYGDHYFNQQNYLQQSMSSRHVSSMAGHLNEGIDVRQQPIFEEEEPIYFNNIAQAQITNQPQPISVSNVMNPSIAQQQRLMQQQMQQQSQLQMQQQQHQLHLQQGPSHISEVESMYGQNEAIEDMLDAPQQMFKGQQALSEYQVNPYDGNNLDDMGNISSYGRNGGGVNSGYYGMNSATPINNSSYEMASASKPYIRSQSHFSNHRHPSSESHRKFDFDYEQNSSSFNKNI